MTATECPNCGAPIDPVRLSEMDDPVCPFCHVAVPATPERVQPVAPVQINIPTYVTSSTTSSRVAGGVLRVIVIASILVGVLGGVGGVAFAIYETVHNASSNSFTNSSGGSGYSTAGTVVVPAGTGSDFYAIVPSDSDTDAQVLRRISPTTDQIDWSTPTLDQESAGRPVVVAGPAQALAIFGTNVVAFDATTGRRLWQASISNKLASPCASTCAVVVGGDLVTLSEDGTVQAFSVTSGAQVWSKRLNSTPHWLEAAGANVLVDETAGSASSLQILVISAASGAARALVPSCAADPDTGITATASDEGGFFVSPDGTALTVLVDSEEGCVVRYRLADGAMLWRTPTDTNNTQIPDTLTGESAVADGTLLAFSNYGNIYALDLATGAIHQVSSISQSQSLTLTGVVGTAILGQLSLQDDNDAPSTVALNGAATGQLWQIATTVNNDNQDQALDITPTNAFIVSCDSDADTCTFEAVNTQNGTITGSSTVPADPGSNDEVTVTDTPTSLEAVAGWDHIVGFNPANAAVQWKWPS